MLRGALEGPVSGTHYVDTFRYPSRGGFVAYLEPLAKRYVIKLDHEVVGINSRDKVVRFRNGSSIAYSALISSVPLPEIAPLIDGAPGDVLEAARALAFTTAVLFNFGIDRDDLSDTAITYFYDEDIVFSRVNLPHMFSPNNAPPGCGTIQAEIYFSDKYKPLRRPGETFTEEVIAGLRRCGFIRDRDRILVQDTAVNRYANVIYDHDRAAAVQTIHGFLNDKQVFYCGRYGNWDHAWTDESFLSGSDAARRALEHL